MTTAVAEVTTATRSVLIVEDQTAIRQLLASFVENVPGFHMTGEAGSAAEAVPLLPRLRPDVLILDWMLPDGTGLDVLRALPASERPKVLVFSANTSDSVVRDAMTSGATGFIEKTASFEQFTDALRAIATGNTYIGSAVANTMRRLVATPAPAQISERERDVLRLVAEGLSSREIAARLELSLRTVENHRANISRRTGIRSVAQFTLLAARLGLISTPAPVTAAR